ncbi:MAG: alginate lyase family protein [Opitutaceae bacterium]
MTISDGRTRTSGSALSRWMMIGGLLFRAASIISAAEVEVASEAALREAISSAGPGDRILLAAGEWKDLDLAFSFAGTAEDPITIAAAVPGKTILGGTTRLAVEGQHGVIAGLRFVDATVVDGASALVQLGGSGRPAASIRLTDCAFEACNPDRPEIRYAWIRLQGREHEIDHCLFAGQNHSGVTVQIVVDEQGPGHLIHHNHFRDRAPGTGNGFEMIQIGQSPDSLKKSGCVVERNWFVRCDGETEIISSKTDGNRIGGNLFLESSGTVTLRHGNRSTVESNFFIGRGKAGSGGVRVIGEGHRVGRNYYGGLTGRTGGVVVLYCGIPDSPLNGYFKADNALIESNLFEGNSGNGIYLNGGFGGRGRTLLPAEIRIRDNLFRVGGDGVVAVAGGLNDVVFEDNLYEGGVDTGVIEPGGLFEWTEPEYGATGPWAWRSAGEVGPTESWPRAQEVGPVWQLSLPGLSLIERARLLELARAQSGQTKALKGSLTDHADAILAAGAVYAVTDNDALPPSGNPHDYYSTGPYWWPDPASPDGLPYILIDGKFNPERDLVSDREPLLGMIGDVEVMGLAYAVTGDEWYAAWGHRLLRTWFLDPETGMTPHLRHAQAIPGRSEGRGTGIIDTHPFAELVDAVALLESSPGFPAEDAAALRDWFGRYLDWLLTSPNGRDEAESVNNHGTAYDLQVAALMSFLGKEDALRAYLETVTRARIDRQFEADGAQPQELRRTRTWSYSTENLEHFFKLGLIGRRVGVDLFAYMNPKGGSLRNALGYLLPSVCDPERWNHPQETEWQEEFITVVLAVGGGVYGDPELEAARQCLRVASNQLEAFVLRPETGEVAGNKP